MKPLTELLDGTDFGDALGIEELSSLIDELAEALTANTATAQLTPLDKLNLMDAHFTNAINYVMTLSFDVLREVRSIQAVIAEMVGAADVVDLSAVDDVNVDQELAGLFLTFDRLSRVYDLVQKASASKLIVP